jgi:putative membrane protein
MAAGEYVSVSSQSDTEKADLHKERFELANNPDAELEELTEIYRLRGLSDALAAEVAKALMEHDALAAHARDEIGITEASSARPMQAALASAASFCAGAILPLLVALTASSAIVPALAVSTLCGLAGLGYVSAKLGGAPVVPAVLRVCLWGVAALVITGFIGKLAGVAV